MNTISKQLVCQKYIYKIHSSRLRKAKWNLTLPLSEARKNDEVISLADSQVLRWLDELNGITDAEQQARAVKAEIRRLRKEPDNIQNRRSIRKLYNLLDSIQFKPDYMCLIIDKKKDYQRARKGFSINGIRYFRLLGTNGGIKNSTIVFASERHIEELRRRIDNGRDMAKPLVTAKLEAYKALTCSASNPVSMPHGVLVVDDCETEFLSDIIYITDECEGEPVSEFRANEQISLDASDGYGLMLPSLAERWSEELGLDYVMSGANTRFSFEKGMVYTFDFLEFAENVAQSYLVKDAWGQTVDIREVELILTTSMVKLYDSYESCDSYLKNSIENGYTFGIAKTCPKTLENEHCTNYQFLQSYTLSDEDIEELIAPTIEEIHDVLGGDWRKTLLFLNGCKMDEKNVGGYGGGYAKAIMANPAVMDDPYVRGCIYQLIRNRINEAKVGVLKVHGNYSIISGDPYALCQSIFGLEVTGLLGVGEIYNKYWADDGAEELACFRAPMTCHNNIRRVRPNRTAEAEHWFRYMTTCTVFNAWDCCLMAMNGADMDGDLVMLTDNPVLVRRMVDLPALMCVQRKAEKVVPTEDDFVTANINSFGNDIGRTTNYITSMFDVQAQFAPGSREYEILSYRIQCGQHYQQTSIDKAKGIICKPMPQTWFDRHAVNKIEDEELRRLYRSLVADKKPYFMRYIYPDLMKRYNTYIRASAKSALREFDMTVDELATIPKEDLTEEQRNFLRYYDYKMPVGTHDCVMNRICRRFEAEFDHIMSVRPDAVPFDYTILKSGAEYKQPQYYQILKLYKSYMERLREYAVYSRCERVDLDEVFQSMNQMRYEFQKDCAGICQNEAILCDILLDICYSKKNTRRFVWDMSGVQIVKNLAEKNGHVLCYPIANLDGDILFGGNRYAIYTKTIKELNEENHSERA